MSESRYKDTREKIQQMSLSLQRLILFKTPVILSV